MKKKKKIKVFVSLPMNGREYKEIKKDMEKSHINFK